MSSEKKVVLSRNNEKNKLLLAGLANVGKTSIYQVIFDDVDPKTIETTPTHNYAVYSPEIEFIDEGNFVVIDIGGQKKYQDLILRQDKDFFKEIVSLVYVIDINKDQDFDESIKNYNELLATVTKYAGAIPVFVFFHKYDPEVNEEEEKIREKKVNQLADLLAKSTYKISKNCILRIYKTSIFDKESLSSSMVDVMSYGLLEDVFRNIVGGIFLEESHNTILTNYKKMIKEDPNNQETLKTFATKLGSNISSMFKEEIVKLQLKSSKSQIVEKKYQKNTFFDSDTSSKPKIEELPTRDLEIEFRCPMIDYGLPQSSKNLESDYCKITHGLLEGILFTLDFQEVEQLQTSIIHNTPTCKFRALTSKIY